MEESRKRDVIRDAEYEDSLSAVFEWVFILHAHVRLSELISAEDLSLALSASLDECSKGPLETGLGTLET